MTRRIVLAQGAGVLEIVPATGGAIANFVVDGRPVLRATPDEFVEAGEVRRHACYPLVPYSNRIDRGRVAFAGETRQLDLNFGEHPHSIHGVGWQRPWALVERGVATALLAYEHRPGDAAGDDAAAADARAWPWPFRATQWLGLANGGASLRTRLAITNAGGEPFPFGLGWHPFFPRDDDTELGFAADGAWQTDATIMPTHHSAVDAAFQFDPPRRIGGAALDNVYTQWRGTAEVRDPHTGWRTIVRGDRACPFFVCYIPRGGSYIAIEPVTHMTDAFNRAERGERDTGTRVLGPGESFAITMEISAERAR